MDIFDVLTAVSRRKTEFIHAGVDETEALSKAEFYVSGDYHIPLLDIRKICG